MTGQDDAAPVGFVGTGRMGTAMVARLLDAGRSVVVWNRTPAKAQPLVERGARLAASMAEVAACPVVFIMVSASDDLLDVLSGEQGLLHAAKRGLEVVVDCSTVSVDASATARGLAAAAGVAFVASPISGNPAVVGAGKACFVCSAPADAFARVEPYLRQIARLAVRVGDEEQSRLVKLCHQLYLGILVQALVEVTTLAEKAGADREAVLGFLGNTIVGSEWVRQRTAALVARDWTPTFTSRLLRKDFDLALGAARAHEVPMLLASTVHQLIQSAISQGLGERDLLSLYELQAAAAGLAHGADA